MPLLFRFCYFSLAFFLLFSGSAARAQRFAAIGDYGQAGPAEQDVATLVKSWNPDFIITLGDNNYNVGDSSTIDANVGQYYHEYIGNYRGKYGPGAAENRFFPSLGNHDMYTRDGEAYLRYFTLPGNERYYEFVKGDVHFFVLNSYDSEPDGISSTSRQARWLQQELAASQSRWKVVYFHHAPYSSGSHGSTTTMRWPFRQWGASMVLAGHDHHFERLRVDGLPYYVNGLGGKSLYWLRPRPVKGSEVLYNADYGAMLLQATPDSLTVQFYTRTGKRIDSHTLLPGPPNAAELYLVVPNPFRETTTVEFSQPASGPVQLRVLDVTGKVVARLYDGELGVGKHQIIWERGSLRAGVYYVHLISGSTTQVARAVAQ
ncbi:metallophosphoesterase [Hymenobacter sp. BT175]|uniref:metallophosphoesterase n=1 Tax=Hymenobacter translucens TaxID=2886507 RepID=UPI001D0F1507|nr:metallophosphoesterase [Hymenobacter translucens]MCC2547191.1 metallophosphoesterase [Hymenobacter translucens]